MQAAGKYSGFGLQLKNRWCSALRLWSKTSYSISSESRLSLRVCRQVEHTCPMLPCLTSKIASRQLYIRYSIGRCPAYVCFGQCMNVLCKAPSAAKLLRTRCIAAAANRRHGYVNSVERFQRLTFGLTLYRNSSQLCHRSTLTVPTSQSRLHSTLSRTLQKFCHALTGDCLSS